MYICVFLSFQRWLTHLHQIIFFLLQMRLEALTPLAVRKGEMWLNTHWSEGETLGEAPENITWDFRVTNDGDYPRLRRFLRILQIYCVLYFHFWNPIQFFLISLLYKFVLQACGPLPMISLLFCTSLYSLKPLHQSKCSLVVILDKFECTRMYLWLLMHGSFSYSVLHAC